MAHFAVPNPEACPHLLDVLEILPLDVLGTNLWDLLLCRQHGEIESTGSAQGDASPYGCCGSFKLACRQSRPLADLLTTAVTHDLSRLPQQAVSDSAAGEADWRRAVHQRSAFLTRLPRLRRLHLKSWRSEADLTTTLSLFCSATQGRLTQLTLSGRPLTVDGVRAVLLACPGLCELDLTTTGDEVLAADPLFWPLHGAEHLTKLVLRHVDSTTFGDSYDNVQEGTLILRSLAGLFRLQHLHLTMQEADLADLPLLTGLHGLQDFSIHCGNYVAVSHISDLEAVFAAATRLTRLSLSKVLYTGPVSPGDISVLALLGSLRGLRSLSLGFQFDVDDPAWAAVRQLSMLTHLGYGEMMATAPAPGHLPLLQTLSIDGGLDRGQPEYVVRPAPLLRALLPLLPLPALVELPGLVVEGALCLSVGPDSEADAAEQFAALRSAAQHLAAAPRVQLGTAVRLWGPTRPYIAGSQGVVSLDDVAASLRVLLEKRTELELNEMDLRGASWGGLQQALPAVRRLVLLNCQLSCLDVACIVQHFPTLVHLRIASSRGWGCVEGEWAQVAEVCRRPLRIEVTPRLLPGLVAECQAVQERLYGLQFIAWGV